MQILVYVIPLPKKERGMAAAEAAGATVDEQEVDERREVTTAIDVCTHILCKVY